MIKVSVNGIAMLGNKAWFILSLVQVLSTIIA